MTIFHSKIIAFDPGTTKSGIAVMQRNNDGKINVLFYDKLVAKGPDAIQRCWDIKEQFKKVYAGYKPDIVVVEYPQVISAEGRFAAARNSGRITVLFHLCGMIHALVGKKFEHYTPTKWKGNVPKHITAKRVFKHYEIIASEDEMDAIALGDWYLKRSNGE